MAKFNFRIILSSDMHGYMAWAKEVNNKLSDRNSSYKNSERDALSDMQRILHDLTYGDYSYEVVRM